jgi:hypothetical protein
MNVSPHVKNNKDSYKLLNGKYPFSSHLQDKRVNIKKLAHNVNRYPTLSVFPKLENAILTQYEIIPPRRHKKDRLSKEFFNTNIFI